MTEQEEYGKHTQAEELRRTLVRELSESGIGQAVLGIARGFNKLIKFFTTSTRG